MFAIGVRYLCGWAMAAHPADRQRAEWPPHPDRVFMALTAAHFETDGGPEEYQGLKQLSALPEPVISASGAYPREVTTTFVPANDDASPVHKGRPLMPSGSLAIGRGRYPRSFPVAVPERDIVYLIWPDAELDEGVRAALAALCRKVAAVGHSASLVQMWVEDRPPPADLEPTSRPTARYRLRVTGPSRLDQLQAQFEAEVRPTPAAWRGYDRSVTTGVDRPVPGSLFDSDLIVLRKERGRPLGLESTLLLTETVRNAVLSRCPDSAPEWVSGHAGRDGPPTRLPHLAYFPLANVGHGHADGRLMGVAVAVPRAVATTDGPRAYLAPLLFSPDGEPAVIRLDLGPLGEWDVTPEDREDRPVALRPETWTGTTADPSRCWATVTPVVLDRYPKKEGDAEATIRQACERVGLPVPEEVVVAPAPPFSGVPHASVFPPLRTGQREGRRFHAHAILTFEGPVLGPVLLGSGRFRGYGLFRPWRGGKP